MTERIRVTYPTPVDYEPGEHVDYMKGRVPVDIGGVIIGTGRILSWDDEVIELEIEMDGEVQFTLDAGTYTAGGKHG